MTSGHCLGQIFVNKRVNVIAHTIPQRFLKHVPIACHLAASKHAQMMKVAVHDAKNN